MNHLLTVLREGFEGPSGNSSWFLDAGPDSGLRRTLAKISAEDATRTAIAAHAHHLLFSFETFAAQLGGDNSPRDWNESWSVKSVDESSWRKLQDDLAAAYEKFRAALDLASDEDSLNTATGGIAHLAYHLGAIRQKLI